MENQRDKVYDFLSLEYALNHILKDNSLSLLCTNKLLINAKYVLLIYELEPKVTEKNVGNTTNYIGVQI